MLRDLPEHVDHALREKKLVGCLYEKDFRAKIVMGGGGTISSFGRGHRTMGAFRCKISKNESHSKGIDHDWKKRFVEQKNFYARRGD